MRVGFNLSPRKIGLILLVFALYLALQSLFTEYLIEDVIGDNADTVLVVVLDLFSVNLESSIPTWYATLLLFMASILLFVIWSAKRQEQDRTRRYWLGLAVIFLYLSMDEGAAIHEILADPLQRTFDTGGYLYFAWQIVAAPLVVIFVLLYLRFLIQLPSHIRKLFIIAGIVFVGGAMGVEAISANQWQPDGNPTMTYLAIATVEESLEMIGAVIFIYSLLVYIADSNYRFLFGPPDENTPSSDVRSLLFQDVIWRRFGYALVIIVIALNGSFFYFATQTDPADHAPVPYSLLAYQGLLEEFASDDVIVVHTTDMFSLDDPSSYQLVGPLVAEFENVTVIVLPDGEVTIVLASDNMTVDQDSIVDVLHRHGEGSFVIFDPVIVRTFVQAMHP